ncbi:hypothetical protein BC937DRAFT_88368 [Endogone sp. FLAS-F59071]|nr:hypothetical protein BC937DRAFT_88368 [Endogone sp. FLAS-F59071]|eukprot:RUS22581.1 hypothetical protein BC937DRAFT_88368 [Endogone sp. FLAS-F59071]
MLRNNASQHHPTLVDKENAVVFQKTPAVKGKDGHLKTPFQATPLVSKSLTKPNPLTKTVLAAKDTKFVPGAKDEAAPRTALRNITNQTPRSFRRSGETKKAIRKIVLQVLDDTNKTRQGTGETESRKAVKQKSRVEVAKIELEIEYGPPKQEERPWDPGFDLTIDFAPLKQVVNSDAYEWAHAFDRPDPELPELEPVDMRRPDDGEKEVELDALLAFDLKGIVDEADEKDLYVSPFEDFVFVV